MSIYYLADKGNYVINKQTAEYLFEFFLTIGFRRPTIDNEKVSRYLRDMYERMMLASMSMGNYLEFDLVHMLLEAIVWPKAE